MAERKDLSHGMMPFDPFALSYKYFRLWRKCLYDARSLSGYDRMVYLNYAVLANAEYEMYSAQEKVAQRT